MNLIKTKLEDYKNSTYQGQLIFSSTRFSLLLKKIDNLVHFFLYQQNDLVVSGIYNKNDLIVKENIKWMNSSNEKVINLMDDIFSFMHLEPL